ncbi:MAG: hypothetical protein RIG77_02055 [Cyclobacteriaceae bacterium]
MNKNNSFYYRLGIVIGLSLLCVLVYSVFSYYKVKKGNTGTLDDYYQNVALAFKNDQFDRSKEQLNKAIESMKSIETGMDSFSRSQIDRSIDELELLQHSIDKDLVSGDFLDVVLSRSLHTLALGEIRRAKSEILRNNLAKGLVSLDNARAHLITSRAYTGVFKQHRDDGLINQIEGLSVALKANENYIDKLDLLSSRSMDLSIGLHTRAPTTSSEP